jgi:hypothetical protein
MGKAATGIWLSQGTFPSSKPRLIGRLIVAFGLFAGTV